VFSILHSGNVFHRGTSLVLNKAERVFWRSELKTLDKLYDEKQREWQKTIDLYDMKFESVKGHFANMGLDDVVPISRYYPLVRQIIATVALNYPKLFFSVDEDVGEDGAEELLERAARNFFKLTRTKEQVHQAIFDALTCSVGWLRLDYNPPGDDMIPPYVTNDAMHEDLVSVSRVYPGNVRIDPVGSPHILGDRRYIDEIMWVPLKFLREDPNVTDKAKENLEPTTISENETLGMGEMSDDSGSPESVAIKESIANGEYVKIHRVHDRIGKRQIMFVDGLFEEISVIDHPFRKMVFPQAIDPLGYPMFDESQEPVLNLEDGQPAPGWLVEEGFQFVPVKFDLHAKDFYPKSHLKYVEAMQLGIVESMTRQANMLKRTGRLGVVAREEVEEDTTIPAKLKKGVDGEWIVGTDVNNFKPIDYPTIPPDQFSYEANLRFYEDETTQVTELQRGGGPRKTATESSLIASSANTNREWMDAGVSAVYARIVQNAFQIMGCPRYTPENFIVNTAPDGQKRLSRALTSADFLFTFQIEVQAGSAQPLFERLMRDDAVNFYDRAMQNPVADTVALFKMLAKSYDIPDPERLMLDQVNIDAQTAAQYENQKMITELAQVPALEEHDHRAHIEVHEQYPNHPIYQQLSQQSQIAVASGLPDPAGQQMAMIDQVMQGHIQQHQQFLEATNLNAPKTKSTRVDVPTDGLINKVRGDAQDTANLVKTGRV
jgi:hypothetical protein